MDLWTLLAIATKAALYGATFVSVGLVMFRAAFGEAAAATGFAFDKWIAASAFVGLLMPLLRLPLRGALLLGGAEGLTDTEMLNLLLTTTVGTVFWLRLAGFGLLLLAVPFPRLRTPLGLCGGALLLWSYAMIGHATEEGRIWVQVLLFVHLAAAAFWIGAFGPLAAGSCAPGGVADLAHRFGVWASVTVPILLVAGIIFAWVLLGSLSALIETGYGWTLMLKLLAVAALLGLAALNKLRLVPALGRATPGAAARLRASIRVEALLAALILTATAVLTTAMELPVP